MKALALLLLSSVAFAGTTSTMVGGISVFHPEGPPVMEPAYRTGEGPPP